MISNSYVKTGLLTGRSWDTTCNWLKSTGVDISDSRSYGNYSNSISPANITGYGSKQVTGFSDKWCVNNIYDLGGNVWEWTNEKYSSRMVNRGGRYYNDGTHDPVSSRDKDEVSYNSNFTSFRVRIYIL